MISKRRVKIMELVINSIKCLELFMLLFSLFFKQGNIYSVPNTKMV